MSRLWALLVVFLVSNCFATTKPRVFITDSQSWEMSAVSGGSNGTFAGHASGGARPQTAEIIKTFGERCPDVTVNNRLEKADYVVVLDHEGGKGLLRRRNKVAVFNGDGDAIVSRSTRSLGNSVQDACEEIVKNWAGRASASESPQANVSPQSSPPPSVALTSPNIVTVPVPAKSESPSKTQTTAATSGVSATLEISSTPSNADIDLDGAFAGNTPSSLGVAPGEHIVRIAKSGYKPWERKLRSLSGTVRIAAELEALPATAASSSPNMTTASTPNRTASPTNVPEPHVEEPTKSSTLDTAASKVKPAVLISRDDPTPAAQTSASSSSSENDGTASVTSTPDGAEIFVDSVGHGHAPALLKLKPGKHRVQLVLQGYKDSLIDVEVKADSIVNVTGKLER